MTDKIGNKFEKYCLHKSVYSSVPKFFGQSFPLKFSPSSQALGLTTVGSYRRCPRNWYSLLYFFRFSHLLTELQFCPLSCVIHPLALWSLPCSFPLQLFLPLSSRQAVFFSNNMPKPLKFYRMLKKGMYTWIMSLIISTFFIAVNQNSRIPFTSRNKNDFEKPSDIYVILTETTPDNFMKKERYTTLG